jgi:tetratricopeptide (TPR) repeat protein
MLAIAARAAAAPIEFLVAEPSGHEVHGDSYVLVLAAQADIDHARALIQKGAAAGATIAVVAIAAGADGRNRDVRAPGEPLWSWHQTSFEGFGDAAIELCDGWPGYVEQDVQRWIDNTNGTICFWSYTVVAELPEPDTTLGIAVGAAALQAAARRRRIACGLAAISLIAIAGCGAPESDGAVAVAEAETPPKAAEAQAMSPVTREDVRSVYRSATFRLAELRRLREQLGAGKFSEVEGALAVYRQQWEHDPRRELDLWNALVGLSRDPALLPRLDEWVRSSPDSYAAVLVRGLHYVHWSGALRGKHWTSETTKGQFERMEQKLVLATRDLEAALQRDPRAIVATTGLIWVAQFRGDLERADRALAIALAIDPANYATRRHWLIAMTPRWGGSYDRMDRLIGEAQSHAAKNPLLLMLRNEKDHDQGRELQRNEKYDEAVEAFTRGLEWGPYPPSLRRRAESLGKLKQPDRALADLNEAIALDVFDSESYQARVELHVDRRDLDLALSDAELAVLVDGFDAWAYKIRGWVRDWRHEFADARRDYAKALEGDPANQWLQKRVADLSGY